MPSLLEKWPEWAQEDRRDDPQKKTRTVPMEVLSLGFPRTGTSSMQAALEILGIGLVCHGEDIFFQSLEMDMMLQGIEAKYLPEKASRAPFGRQEFDQLLGKYRAVSNAPCCHVGAELMTTYPEAKVILVEKDIDSWYQDRSTINFRTA